MTFPGNEKALTNHCLLLIARGEEEGCWHHLLLCVFTIFLFFWGGLHPFLQKRGSLQGSGDTQQTLLLMTEEMMRSASPSLSVLGSLPLLFFVSTNWHWLRGGIVLAKMWKGQPGCAPVVLSIKFNREERESVPLFFFFLPAVFFLVFFS